MIIKMSDIYKEVAKENDLNPDIVSSVGNTTFASLLECLMKPREISYELPKLGAFNIRTKSWYKYNHTYTNLTKAGAINNEVEAERVRSVTQKIIDYRQKKKEVKQKRKEQIDGNRDSN